MRYCSLAVTQLALAVIDLDILVFECSMKPEESSSMSLSPFLTSTPGSMIHLMVRGDGAPLGAGADGANDVAVLGRLQRAAFDDGDFQLFPPDRPGVAAKRFLAEQAAAEP